MYFYRIKLFTITLIPLFFFISGCSNKNSDGQIIKNSGNIQSIIRPDGKTEVGTIINDKKNGEWTETRFDGTTGGGNYIDDKKNGEWVNSRPGGSKEIGSYIDDKKNGEWIFIKDYKKEVGNYIDDKKNGEWTEILPSQGKKVGKYFNDFEYGEWILTRPDGSISILDHGEKIE